jgi:ankyrin repeat protein
MLNGRTARPHCTLPATAGGSRLRNYFSTTARTRKRRTVPSLHQVAGGQHPSQEDGIRVPRLLLKHGADVNSQNSNHETPLHATSAYRRFEITRVLLVRTILKNEPGQNPSYLCLDGEYCASKQFCVTDAFSQSAWYM